MKRKIIHNAINNQEDEDSSASPIHFLSNETSTTNQTENVNEANCMESLNDISEGQETPKDA